MFHVQTLRKNKTIKNVIQYLCHIRKKIEMLTFKLIGISLTFKKNWFSGNKELPYLQQNTTLAISLVQMRRLIQDLLNFNATFPARQLAL